ncbi:beta-ketoacyl-[acyl-carrier-protein] synthase family protein [Sulfurimonas sp.]|uniref:beta-ketoacyl-[acyl-carrier-protein] synthase family protein n=1 Tax=Sulfurimonas sp. TaxID=2022749 RepID=UPI002B45FD49|nr:beta-ketoacyl-[acyl-carrier-protein] synthase family protein [Sulfurimonas sp.]
MKRRVVITGIGIKSPIGNSLSEFQENLFAKKSGIQTMNCWDPIIGLKTKVAGIVVGIDEKEIPRKNRRSMDRGSILAALASKDAIFDAKLSQKEISSYRTGISYGSTVGGGATLEKVFGDLREDKSYMKQTSMDFLKYMSNTVCANLCSYLNIKGISIPICSACTSSSQAIGMSYELIQNSQMDRMICGGAEGMHHSLASIFDVMGAASSAYNQTPEQSSRPFDKNRDGVVVAEGAGTLILEDRDTALKRGAKIYAEIISYSTNCNGSHMTNPNEDSIIHVMERAINNANLKATEIDYVNAHATSTYLGDIVESNAIYKLFKDKVPVSSLKGQIGHTLGACGAIESIAAICSIIQNKLPSNINIDNLDEECSSLDYIKEVRKQEVTIVLKNNFAFGGINTSLIFKKYT